MYGMSDLQTKIEEAAHEFASHIVAMLKGMTIDEIAGLVQNAGTAVVERVKVKRTARAKPVATPVASPVVTPKGKPRSSAKQADARRIQGRYLGFLRNFKGAERARIMALGKKSGIPAAVAEMIKLRGKKAAPVSKVAAPKNVPAAKKAPAKKKLALSPQRKAQLKVQGQYIGFMRSLPAAKKARMKALAAKKGMAAAVAVMQKAAAK
jgi:hypothetical protein